MIPLSEQLSLPDPISLFPKEIREELRKELMALSFHGFEALIRELLQAMGYTQVRLLGRTQWRQPTRHGGYDMEAAARTGVSHTRLIVQVKQYTRPVSRRYVDELRGALLRLHGGQGLIISTSTFSKVAKNAALSDKITPIRLVDGEELTDLLMLYQIGVCVETPKTPWSLDHSYFSQLHTRYPHSTGVHTADPHHHIVTSTRRPSRNTAEEKGGGMLWRTHVLGGVTCLWLEKLIPGALTANTLLPLSALACLGALLPDLDASEAKIQHLGVGGIEPCAPLSAFAHKTFGHRGILHSAIGLLAISLIAIPIALFFGIAPYLALLLGYGSHLVLDALTPHGIAFLPGKATRQHLLPKRLRIATGSVEEEMLFATLAMPVFFLVILQIAKL